MRAMEGHRSPIAPSTGERSRCRPSQDLVHAHAICAYRPTDGAGDPNYYAGGYYTAKAQKLIEAVETAPAKDGLEALYKDEAYLAKQLPSLWWPLQDWQIVVAKKGLSGWQHLNAYANYMPQTWYYTKAG